MFRQSASQGCLTGTRTAADDDELHDRGSEVFHGDADVTVRIGDRFAVSLPDADAVDFGADDGAVGDAELHQAAWGRVMGVPHVVFEEAVGEVSSAEEFQ